LDEKKRTRLSAFYFERRAMKKAAIIVNAYTHAESELNQPRRIAEELTALGVKAELVRNANFPVRLTRDGFYNTLSEYDFCVYLDKDKYAARLLEAGGMRLFNRAEAIEVCDDKMLTAIALQGVAPMPKTLPAPLCYYLNEPVSSEMLDTVERELGYPVVMKECFGSCGKGVFLARDREELRETAERLKGKPHLFQEFICESAGRDLRVIVVGGKVVSAMRRVSETDFRSNAELGGRGEPFVPDETATRLCEKIADRLKLDYCGIDLLFSERGYLVCEVNSNAFFKTMERVTKVNVARAYAEYLFRTVYQMK